MRTIRISDVESFLVNNFKEIALGNGKYKLKAECSWVELLSKFEEYCKQL